MRITKFMILTLSLMLLLSGLVFGAQSADFDKGYVDAKTYVTLYDYKDKTEIESLYHWFSTKEYNDNPFYPTTGATGWQDYQDGFIKGIKDAKAGIKTEINYAESLGSAAGLAAGRRDFYTNSSADPNRVKPSDSWISSTFNLSNTPADFRTSFIEKFRTSFLEAYMKGYEEALLEPKKVSLEQGLSDGEAAGAVMGSVAGERDYILKKTLDYNRDLPLDSAITARHSLSLQDYTYADAFIQGYKFGYEKAYIEGYRALAQEAAVGGIVSELVPIAGSVVQSEGDGLSVEVRQGTFYRPTYLTIKNMLSQYYNTSEYVRASDVFSVTLENPEYQMDKTKRIKLQFPYYGDPYKSGIYKLVDGKWNYLPSRISEGFITAEVNPITLANRESIYAVFMDENIKIITDVRSHYAKDEIYTMIRRGIIYGYPDGTFKPNAGVTRGEFLILLSRQYNWTLPTYVANATYFNDHSTFNYYDRIISYALSMGYIKGYPDRTFRPNNNISYKEIELIMQRYHNDTSLTWNNIATRMMYDKAMRSPSFDNMNNKITRAEVAYMLYIVNEWKY